MNFTRIFGLFLVFGTSLAGGCALLENQPPKVASSSGLIATPPSYYSTPKARYLGSKYKENLDRLIERIVRNPKTSNLQFANNISSVGGIGFFTHSATKNADERYLEVVMGTPETFETKGAHSEKVARLFSLYGEELLATLSNDNDIFQDKELAGYGLNLAWRNVVPESAGNRVVMERAIAYFPKERVRGFLRQKISQNDLLSDAVIFAVEEDGPLQLVSYRPQEIRADFRPAIRVDNLAATTPEPPPAAVREASQSAEKNRDAIGIEEPTIKESAVALEVNPTHRETQAAKAPVSSEQKSALVAPERPLPPIAAVTKTKPVPAQLADEFVGKPIPEIASQTSAPTVEKKAETARNLPLSSAPKPIPETRKPTAAMKPVEEVPLVRAPAPAPKIAVEPPAKPAAVEAKPRAPVGSPAGVVSAAKPVEVKAPAEAATAESSPGVVQPPVELSTAPVEQSAPAAKISAVAKPAPLPSAKKMAPPAVAQKPAPPAGGPTPREIGGEKSPGEQIALLPSKPSEALPQIKPLIRPAPRALEGFIVQVAFNERAKAQRWAENMERRGYAVSITEAGAEGALRVRLGNFAQRDEAERELRTFQKEGLKGIVVSLPQGFRPEARSSIP